MSRMEAETQPSVASAPVRRRWMLFLAATMVIGASILARGLVGSSAAVAQVPQSTEPGTSHQATRTEATARDVGPQHDVMAIVNGQDISRTALAQGAVERHGEEVLESLVNKRLIEHHCRKRGVSVTEADIEAEIDRMTKRFKLGREQWFELLKNQRGITPEEYTRDILWPTLALRKLAASDLAASDDEVQRAYETRFGESVQVRLIVVSNRKKAEQLHREATARPKEFARLAMQQSEDVNSASIGGLIQPIRQHTGEPQLEQAAFALQPGEISQVIHAGEQFALLKCEGHLPARAIPMAQVREELEEGIKEEKLRGVANNLFGKLQASATIQNVYNDPQLRGQMPGVVAKVNGEPITMRELGNECLTRHGEEVLQIEISHLLLRQELKRAGLDLSQQDLHDETAHAAKLAGVLGPSGKPDLGQWVKVATAEQGVSEDLYYRDSVWPSAALKKLTTGLVTVSEDDLAKGFEANYGKRVRCRAIVLSDLRRAQEVWDKARQNPTLEHFGNLAEQYSIEPSSRSLRGEVPPVRINGGQPQLEQAAFALSEGELSGITQVGDKFVILHCEGFTEPLEIDPSEVRELLSQDLFEKKLRLAMSEEFGRIRAKARIDNYLAGTSQSPPKQEQANGRKRDGAVRQTSGQR